MKLKNGGSVSRTNEFLYFGMVTYDQLQPWIDKDYRVIDSEFYPDLDKGNFALVKN